MNSEFKIYVKCLKLINFCHIELMNKICLNYEQTMQSSDNKGLKFGAEDKIIQN